VLTNGALPAMVVIDAVTRLLPGVLATTKVRTMSRFSHGLLEYPQYTRPAEFRGMKVPDVLVSATTPRLRNGGVSRRSYGQKNSGQIC